MMTHVPQNALDAAAYGIRYVAEDEGLHLDTSNTTRLALAALANALSSGQVVTREQLLDERKRAEEKILKLQQSNAAKLNEIDRLRQDLGRIHQAIHQAFHPKPPT